MASVWTSILVSLVTSGGLIGALTWLARTWIGARITSAVKHEYDHTLESHKAELQAELARLSGELRVAAFRQETRFAKLHERRAEVVAEIYGRLQELYVRVADYVKIIGHQGDLPLEERRELVNKAIREFASYYRPVQIFLPTETEARVTELQRALVNIASRFADGVEFRGDDRSGRDSWNESFEQLDSIDLCALKVTGGRGSGLLGACDPKEQPPSWKPVGGGQ